MGKTQSKRSVDITTETKKGTEEEITEKMEKIEDLDKKEVLNGDATIPEKIYLKDKDTEEVENDKDTSTEKDVDVQASGDAAKLQNAVETSKDEDSSTAVEEISPLADECIKKSKKEKVKKKWSFRSISFGKKDKQKPAKTEDATEDCSAATNGAEADEKTINEPEDTPNEKSANENDEKSKENHENGNSFPRECEPKEEKPSNEKSNDITANTTNNSINTETCEPVQKEDATATLELSDKTESTAFNENKLSENSTVDDTSKILNGIDEKINAKDQDPQNKDVTNASIESALDKTNTLDSAVTNDSSVTTNGEVVDQNHQNGDHGESDHEFVEKSKEQIEVNFTTDNKVSADTLDYISSTSINPFNIQIHAQDLNASSEKTDEIIQFNNGESVIKKSIVTEKINSTIEKSSLSESVRIVDVKNNLQIEAVSDLTSEAICNEKLSEEELGVDPSPPPLPISPPPSQVSVFAFTNDESGADSTKSKIFERTTNSINVEKEILPPLSQLPVTEKINTCHEIKLISSENIDERKSSHVDGDNENFEIQCQDYKEVKEKETLCKDLNIESTVLFADRFEEAQKDETSVAVAAAMIDEITELATEILNQQLKCNKEQITDKLYAECNEEIKEKDKTNNENEYMECNNKAQNHNDDHVNDPEYVCEAVLSTFESLKQINNDNIECSLDFTTTNKIRQYQDEMNFLKKTDNFDEKHIDPTKEFGTAKDIKDTVTIAELTQDLSVTCE